MKIGILTHYYKSPNYGGNLQAYALARFLRASGFDAEQICYDIFFKRERKESFLKHFIKILGKVPAYILRVMVRKILLKKRLNIVKNAVNRRILAISNFNQNIINHSDTTYGYGNIGEANSHYDAFITGSDQVWHPNNFCPAYLLTFADSKKKKISYAASIAKSDLSNEEINRLTTSIAVYTAVSVREEDSAELLRRNSQKDICCVVDPVFLLSEKQWDDVAKPYPIDAPYLLTYFLGNNESSRFLAQKFAKEHNLKLVTMPYLNGSYRKCDWNFGDKQIFDAGPEHFVSLVKNAEYVFTDSFHATAFSVLFGTKFFVFPRSYKKTGDMSNRIVSILNLCACEECFCNTLEKMKMEYLNSIWTNNKIVRDNLAQKISFSKNYLINALQ